MITIRVAVQMILLKTVFLLSKWEKQLGKGTKKPRAKRKPREKKPIPQAGTPLPMD